MNFLFVVFGVRKKCLFFVETTEQHRVETKSRLTFIKFLMNLMVTFDSGIWWV